MFLKQASLELEGHGRVLPAFILNGRRETGLPLYDWWKSALEIECKEGHSSQHDFGAGLPPFMIGRRVQWKSSARKGAHPSMISALWVLDIVVAMGSG